jgi:hypothetical protein
MRFYCPLLLYWKDMKIVIRDGTDFFFSFNDIFHYSYVIYFKVDIHSLDLELQIL